MYNEAIKKAHDKYRETHRDKVNEYNRLYFKKRRDEDENFRLEQNKLANDALKKKYKEDPEYRALILQKKKEYYQMKKAKKLIK